VRTQGTASPALLLALLIAAVVCGCSNPEKEKLAHVQSGDRYVAQKRDDFAVIEYQRAIKLDPKYGEALWKLGQVYERTGDLRNAFPAFIRAADASPENRAAQVKAGEVLLVTGRFEDAKARAAALISRDAKDIEARLIQVNALAALGDVKAALSEAEQTIELNPRHSGALLTLGSVHARAGQVKEAEAAFRQAAAADPESPVVRLPLATLLIRTGRASEAEPVLREVLSKVPRDPAANRILADLYLSTGRPQDAEEPLKIVAAESKDDRAKFQLATYLENTGRTTEATDVLEALSKESSSPAGAEMRLAAIEYKAGRKADAYKRVDALLARVSNYSPALVMKALWLAGDNKLDEGLSAARAAVVADAQSADAYAALATIQEQRRETADAIKSYKEALRLNPRAAGVQANLSRLSLMAGQRDAALSAAEDARRADPSNVSARVALLRSLIAANDVARADVEAAELVRVAPKDATVQTLQGLLVLRKGNATAARASFERALELSPGFLEALAGLTALDLRANASGVAIARVESELAKQPSNVGLMALAAQAYSGAGQNAKAEQTLKRAVALDSRFTNGYTMLAQLYVRQRRLPEARAEFEGIALRDPSAAGPRTMVGMLLEAEGKPDEARQVYERIVAANIDAPVAANNLAYLYANRDTNLDVALRLAASAKPKLPDDPNVDDTIGWIYYKKNLPELARSPLEASARRLPQNPDVLYHLGLTYAKLGESFKAREVLSRARKLDASIGGADLDDALASLPR
jgi:tetratricopeptide (TPR) repeat protein